jgi:SAM-dependent methyltransferase
MSSSYGQLDPYPHIAEADPVAAREHADVLEQRSRAPEQLAMRETYLDLLGVAAGQRILEVGCGTGPTLRDVARRVGPHGRAVGIDPSAVFIEVALERAEQEGLAGHLEARVADGAHLPFADGAFDAVLAVSTLSHMPQAERAIAEMARVVRPGGRVGIFENDLDAVILNHPDRAMTRRIIAALGDHAFFDAWLIRRAPGLLEAAGLRGVQVHPITAVERDTSGWYARLSEVRAEVAAQAGVITEAERDDWLAALRAEQASGRFLALGVALFVWGERPS